MRNQRPAHQAIFAGLTLTLLFFCPLSQAQEETELPQSRDELAHFLLLAKESQVTAKDELTKANGRLKFHQDRLSYLRDRLEKARKDVDMRTVYAGQTLAGGVGTEIADAAFMLREAENMALMLQQQVQPIEARVGVAEDEVTMWADELERTRGLSSMLTKAIADLPPREVGAGGQALPHEATCPICRRRQH